jgi:hypothetical protein
MRSIVGVSVMDLVPIRLGDVRSIAPAKPLVVKELKISSMVSGVKLLP